MKSAAIRQAFLDFFNSKNHTVVASSSLVPGNDATLLFTNAGMVQFKDTFLGNETRAYSRAVTSQRCVRAGGKHNDLENVGYTARHHTFFEMMGNFSFGDYFKREAIAYAWQFLTEELKLPKEKLWVTVHHSDAQAEKIWFEDIGIDPSRFSRLDEDNFWSMGDTGPCGPCSEIFYDHGPEVWGGPPGSPEEDGDRYIEIWNMVFMQYNRDAKGNMTPLPKQSIDTGMGLERLAAVLQGVHSNYEIDLFQNLLNAAAQIIGTDDLANKSLCVIADHIRSVSFLITDGVQPSNEGRGYVLRRIIRRAVRHGHKLGAQETFFYKLVDALVIEMGQAFPELAQAQKRIENTILQEEKQFSKTLEQGMRVLDSGIDNIQGNTISGELVFKLYDTYGFPVDLTSDIARERNLDIDIDGFEKAMDEQRTRARSARAFAQDYNQTIKLEGTTHFTGYEKLQGTSEVTGLFKDNEPVSVVNADEEVQLVLDCTPFYAESGGQVGDMGSLNWQEGRVDITDTQQQGDLIIHYGKVIQGSLTQGQQVEAQVDTVKRQRTAANHSATHLLHESMRQLLGEHVMQKGSLVDDMRLRFDFSNPEPLTQSQISAIEKSVNQQIRMNTPVRDEVMPIEAAKQQGAMALFGEKYSDDVRVVSMGNVASAQESDAKQFSLELCGGTHVKRTGDIGCFVIVSEVGIASGIRRIEALTGDAASQWLGDSNQTLHNIALQVKTNRQQVTDKINTILQQNRALEKQVEQLKNKLAVSHTAEITNQAIKVKGIAILITEIQNVEPNALRSMMDTLRNQLGNSVVLLATNQDAKASIVCGVSKALTDKINAGEVVKFAAEKMQGKGGGRADMAQGGGDASLLSQALTETKAWLEQQIT